MNTSRLRHEASICNTTPVRYFALVGRFDLLVQALGGQVNVPRTVLDPEEDPDVEPASLLSEIGQSERYWVVRSSHADELENWSRLRTLRQRTDVEIVDLSDDELELFGILLSQSFARDMGFALPLGRGEAAVIAIAETRGWDAIMDDAAARRALQHRAPSVSIHTTRDILRMSVEQDLVSRSEAEDIYLSMRDKRLIGPDELWP